MLSEALTWLMTPAGSEARRLGYLGEAIALQSRARRCRGAWREHIEHCHAAVRTSLERCASQRTALVLGSGLALEYPLDELAARFDRVVLADRVHLGTVRRLARRHANVVVIETDLTGIAARLLERGAGISGTELDAWSETAPQCCADLCGVDWVLSSNVLSQLPLLPAAWLARRCPGLGEAAIERFGRRLMLRHLEFLSAFDAVRCLITDATQTLRAADGAVLEHTDFATLLDLDRHAYASWDWPIAPPGELAGDLRRSHRVVACHWPGTQG